jgi:hypothetical protein
LVMLGCLNFVIFCVNGRKVPCWLGIKILSIPFYEDFGIVITNQHGTFQSKFGYGMTNRNVPTVSVGKRYWSNLIFSDRNVHGAAVVKVQMDSNGLPKRHSELIGCRYKLC